MPVDPERLTEFVTDRPITPGTRHIALVDPDGDTHTGYLASVLTRGARQIDGYVSHFSTCPQAAEHRRG